MEVIRGEDARVGHNARNQTRRRNVERRIVALHAFARRPHTHGLQDEVRVAHFDVQGIHRRVTLVRGAGREVRHAHVLGDDGDLEGADLVADVAVQTDRVRRGGEHVDALLLHDEGGHVVGDDRHVKAHVVSDGRGQARALEVRTGLRAEEAQVVAALPGHAQHLADDRLAEALGHDLAVLREHVHEVLRHPADLGIAGVVALHSVIDDGLRRVNTRENRLLRNREAALGDQLHAGDRRRAGMADGIGGLLQVRELRILRHAPALVGRQRHAHGRSGVRACALGHHIRDGLGDLLMRLAGHELDPAGIDAAVEDAHLAAVIPGHVLILEHKGQALVLSFHYFLSPL